MSQNVLDRLKAQFAGGELLDTGSHVGDEWARVRRDAWVAVATFLRDDPSTKMEMFIDLTVVDRFSTEPRFDVVVHLYSLPLNMGPSHPAMHGTVRMVLDVEGEKISNADVQIGYLHRCFEKESEYATWTQVFPYTDRLNYISPMLNNVGYAMAVEKLMGITDEIPERAQFIRVI